MSKFKKVDPDSVTGVVFAGSNGFSCNGVFMPKSLLEVNKKTLLQYTIENMLELNLSEIYVFCDENEIIYNNIVAKYENVHLMVCDNYDSTFFIVQNYIGLFTGEYILFLYENSPNSPKYLESLMTNELVVSTYSNSTKKSKIRIDDKFVEPPYFIKKSFVYNTTAITWLTFFTVNKNKITFIKDLGPCEFNTQEEFMTYKDHVSKNF